MKVKRQTLFIAAAILLLVGIAALMLVIGRGHIIYVDNKTIEYNGTQYKAFEYVLMDSKGNKTQEAYARERVQLTCVGQTLKINYEITKKKNGTPEQGSFTVKIPYSWDMTVINLPAYFAGLDQEVWLTEFIQAPSTDNTVQEEIVLDEFAGLS